MRLAIVLSLTAAVAGAYACSDGGAPAPPPGGVASPSPSAPAPGTTPTAVADGSAPAAVADCDGVPARCDAWNVRAHCVVAAGAPSWRTETCAGGCFAGQCSTTACADECALGATCKLWDMKAGAYALPDAATKLHDRARDYDRILRAVDLPEGQVMNAHYVDATYGAIHDYRGYHDAAIWTGTALAAQAFRLLATRDPDAATELDAIVKTVHRDLAISGDPGYLARVVVRSGAAGTALSDPNHCADPEFHCGVTWQGASYDWLGATSRDQYTGVILGYALAYAASTNESTKQTIRGDLVTIATELMKVHVDVPAVIVVNGAPLQKKLTLENAILAPSEMDAGRIRVELSTSNPSESKITGMRELFPDYAILVKQALGVSIAIPRPSTAVILGAIFRAALAATEGVATMKTTHDAIHAYYQAHASAWLDVAAGWTFDAKCGSGYFANHLAVVMAYAWSAFETDPVLLPRIRDDVLGSKLWPALGGHKNSYFAFLWGGTRPSPSKGVVDAAALQLAAFAPGPRIHAGRANASKPGYLPHDTTCTAPALCDTKTLAVDVADRVVDDFIWQRQPWQLDDAGDVLDVFPGVDYLVAYWAARRYGFVSDDREGTCTRRTP